MLDKIVNKAVKTFISYKYKNVIDYKNNPIRAQHNWYSYITMTMTNTRYGKDVGLYRGMKYEQFRRSIPIRSYEDIYPYIERMLRGDVNILWPGSVEWFSKSSGTTNAKSKFIPVTDENLKQCHMKGSWDSMAIYIEKYPASKIFTKKSIVMGGSLSYSEFNENISVGDISAIMIHKMPVLGRSFSTPNKEISLLNDWEQKIEIIAQELVKQDITLFGGVPTWTIVLFNRLLDITGKSTIKEIWPSVEAYFHGGVGFEPYRNTFDQLLGVDNFHYQEIYNASEGYFAAQDLIEPGSMLLLLDNGIFYEFAPLVDGQVQYEHTVPLEEVETNQVYAMVISTNSGLLRYKLGDTVLFSSVKPYRISISGRTKQFINAFGEEVMVDNTDKAIAHACRVTNAVVSDYSVAPVYINSGHRGRHQWLIEFQQRPKDLKEFSRILDKELQSINGDYQAKRTSNLALTELEIISVDENTFHNWLKLKGKYGGQNKVPRLSNNREFMDDILAFINNS